MGSRHGWSVVGRGFVVVCVVLAGTTTTAAALAASATEALEPARLRCERVVDPVGIDAAQPRLGWIGESRERGQRQTAYRVQVASSPNLLAGGRADLWDSGKVASDRSVDVPYAGARLRSWQACFWRVRAWDAHGRPSRWSGLARWTVGLLSRSDWRGHWVAYTSPTDPAPPELVGAPQPGGRSAWPQARPSPILRTEFAARPGVRRALLAICGLGYYEARINGRKVGDHVLDPAFTRYDRRALYVMHDVTRYVRSGRNAIGVMLGNGFFYPLSRDAWDFTRAPWRDRPQVLAQIRLEYADGSVQTVATDRTWRASTGPVLRDGVRHGELYDARQEKDGWDRAGYDASRWAAPDVVAGPKGSLRAQAALPIHVMATLRPAKVAEPRPGVYVFDMGQTFAGWAQLRVAGPAGTKVTLRYGEKLDGSGMVSQANIATLVHDGPFQTDVYVLRGAGTEVWEPRFTYHGFRYVEVTGYPGRPTLDALRGRVVHTAFEPAGTFECSNPLLNAIQRLTLWSYRSNFVGIPTDCPHREKNGWTGDAQLACEQALTNWDSATAYEKWLDDLGDEQRADGALPGIVPTSGWGYQWGNGPPWDSAYVLIPWYLYRHTGDRAALAKHYSGMKRYVDYLGTRARDRIVDFGLGDWVPYRTETSTAVTGTGYYYADALVVARAAEVLGMRGDAIRYGELAARIRDSFARAFIGRDGTVANSSQTALSCALYQGLAESDRVPAIVARLAADLESKDAHIDTGILGARYLFHALTDNGRHDLAYRVATQTTLPSYGYWVRQGATTLWEDWGGGASLDHIMFGDISAWFYRALAGLDLDPEVPGYRLFVVRPRPVGDLAWVRAAHQSPYGRIAVAWRLKGSRLTLDVAAPPGTMATVYVPTSRPASVTEGGRAARSSPGVRLLRAEPGAAVYSVTSGTYHFAADR